MNTNNDKFIEASKRERYTLKYILPLIKEKMPKDYEWTEYITDIYGYDVYDCLLQAYIEGSIQKRFIIEVKIRDKHWEDLILETEKLKSLKSKIFDDKAQILYINITPKGTYIFNLTKLEKQNKLVKNTLMANKATMASRDEKVNKGVYFLNVGDALKLEWTFNENEYKESIQSVIKTNWENKAKKCLFDYLLGNEKEN